MYRYNEYAHVEVPMCNTISTLHLNISSHSQIVFYFWAFKFIELHSGKPGNSSQPENFVSEQYQQQKFIPNNKSA